MRVDLLIRNLSEVVPLSGEPGARAIAAARVEPIRAGAVAVRDGKVVAVGLERDLVGSVEAAVEVDGEGGVLLPGFCDCHTHAVFACDRDPEWEQRLAGATYQEIAAAGGGIRSSVRALRETSADDLFERAARRLDRMLVAGTTSAEVKSGYGLSLASERKSLEVIARLGREHPVHVVPTFLGAHEVPDEFQRDREGYIRLLIEEMLPALAPLARFCDVFCEDHVFTVEQSRRILEAGRAHGLTPKLHADELSPLGGAELAAEVGAASADHLVAASAEGLRAMAARGVVGVLLPGTSYFLRLERKPRVAAMREAGLAVALATDCNPGSCPTESMGAVLSLACHRYGLTPEEALVGATVNAAHAIGEGERRGSIEAGKVADLVIYRCERWQQVPYHFGVSLVDRVFTAGRLAYTAPGRFRVPS